MTKLLAMLVIGVIILATVIKELHIMYYLEAMKADPSSGFMDGIPAWKGALLLLLSLLTGAIVAGLAIAGVLALVSTIAI